MTLKEKELLYYTLCKVKGQLGPNEATLNLMREQLSTSVQKTKLSVSSLI